MLPLALWRAGALAGRRWRRSTGSRESCSRSRRARGRAAWRRQGRDPAHTIRLTLGVKDVLLLKNRDDVPQIFGPTLIMPGQSFRCRSRWHRPTAFACTAHASGQMTVIVDPARAGWERLRWRTRAWLMARREAGLNAAEAGAAPRCWSSRCSSRSGGRRRKTESAIFPTPLAGRHRRAGSWRGRHAVGAHRRVAVSRRHRLRAGRAGRRAARPVDGLGARRLLTLNPLFQMLRPISPIAWIPIAILWFGVGDVSPIFLIFISSVFPMIVQTTSACTRSTGATCARPRTSASRARRCSAAS
jgi:hypothetical protein